MPDSMETSYNDWVGRKRAKLKRSTLDCGHANPGDVHYHYWCDRLSCSKECANAGHDCGLFKGKSESGSEGEAVEPEAVVDPPTPRPLTLSPETYRALYGPVEAIRQAQPLRSVRLAETWHCPRCDFSTFIGGLKRLHEVACPTPLVGELEDAEHAAAARCTCPMIDATAIGDDGGEGIRTFVQGYNTDCPVCPAPAAPLVDELVEPDPNVPRCILASCVEVGRHNHLEPPPSASLYCAGCGRDITYSGVCARCPEPPWAAEMRARMARDTRPWWRRYLPGGRS